MGKHDEYGKELFGELLGNRWDTLAYQRSVDEGGVRADLDGVIWSEDRQLIECAVEIEARVYKQIRGAIVDLALHPAPKKLLVIILAQPQLGGEDKALAHCAYVWEQITNRGKGKFSIACLKGTGEYKIPKIDKAIIKDALERLEMTG